MSIVPFRSFLVAGLFLLLSAAYALAAPSSIVSPNVVMIISDDMGLIALRHARYFGKSREIVGRSRLLFKASNCGEIG